MRLARALALAGVTSRRKAEQLILDGDVTVNGQVVTKLPTQVDPACDEIRVDGARIRAEQKVYLILNKPRRVVSTASDPEGRKTVLDYVPKKIRARLYPVGRLDYDSSGLVFFTNDGELAHRMTHPRFGVTKRYTAELNRALDERDKRRLEKGIILEGKKTAPCRIFIRNPKYPLIELKEGRKRQIRLMFQMLGYLVEKLERIEMGPLNTKGLPRGEVRSLTSGEIARLKKVVGLL